MITNAYTNDTVKAYIKNVNITEVNGDVDVLAKGNTDAKQNFR